jgi:membrane associated rhomboid family serine protease
LLVVVVPLPAILFLSGWLAMQIFHGMVESSVVDGVAWWAHIGGFVFGMVVTIVLRVLGALRPAVPRIRIEVRRWRG